MKKSKIDAFIEKTICPFARGSNYVKGPKVEIGNFNEDLFWKNRAKLISDWVKNPAQDILIIEANESHFNNIQKLSILVRTTLNKIHKVIEGKRMLLPSQIENWSYVLLGERILILAFAPFYDKTHSRHSLNIDSVFLVFQKDKSFERALRRNELLIPLKVRNDVRWEYKKKGIEYNVGISMSPNDEYKIIRPISDNDELIKWWLE